MKEKMNYNKYENYIRIGHLEDGTDLQDFPTPSALGTTLADVDKDPFTDLEGYTQRNRVRHDVVSITLDYNVLSDNDLQYILNRISPVWFYVELIDKKTKQKKIHKMYASDKTFETWRIWQDSSGNWNEEDIAFSVTFVEQ